MKNILIFACIAGIASAIAIYFTSEANKDSGLGRVADAAGDAYDTMNRGIGSVERSTRNSFDSMS
jgi:hypothetical protein